VAAQLIEAAEVLTAGRLGAVVGAFGLVGAAVLGEVGRLGKGAAAELADERLLARVAADVHGQGAGLAERLVADVALARLLPGVDQQMLLERLLAREGVAALLAAERLDWSTGSATSLRAFKG